MRGRIPWRQIEGEIYDGVDAVKNPRKREKQTQRKVFHEVYHEVINLSDILEAPTLKSDPEVVKAKWRTAIENRMRDGKESTYKLDPLTIWVIGMILELAFRWWWNNRREAK